MQVEINLLLISVRITETAKIMCSAKSVIAKCISGRSAPKKCHAHGHSGRGRGNIGHTHDADTGCQTVSPVLHQYGHEIVHYQTQIEVPAETLLF